jgi:uncharacterized protein (TIGR03118 family)
MLGLLLIFVSGSALAQYKVTNLASDLPGTHHTYSQLKNPWGLAYGPGGEYWVSDQVTGFSTLYNDKGIQAPLVVQIPPAGGVGTGTGSPTGIVYNGSQEFAIDNWVSAFLFCTLDGTISGWSVFSPKLALIGASKPGASYTGLAITSKPSGNSLFAADAANNVVDIYDGNFNLTGSFTDATIPAGFSVFNVQDIGGQLYVAYVASDGSAGGYIDIYTEEGRFVKRFASNGPLNQPFGFAIAPYNFGAFSNALLVSNNATAGTVVGYNLTTGDLIGTISDSSGNPLIINGIWGIEFGGGNSGSGAKNQLFFAAGPNDYDGYFGVIGVD